MGKVSKLPPIGKVEQELSAYKRRGSNPCKKNFSADLTAWAYDLSTLSSIHGVVWYNRVENRCFKFFIFISTLAIITALPVYVIFQLVSFNRNAEVINAVTWNKTAIETYPNITLCHSKYFDKRKLEALNISTELANYMTLALDMTLPEFYKYMNSESLGTGDYFARLMNEYGEELDDLLTRLDMDLFQLFNKVAIGCDDFIMMCEVHREFFLSPTMSTEGSSSPSCCDHMFNKKPIFTSSGTCFTSNTPIYERVPNVVSNVRIWTDFRYENTIEFILMIKGGDAADRKGGFFAITEKDVLPGPAMTSEPKRFQAGTSNLIGIKKSEVYRINSGSPCLAGNNQTFRELFGVEETSNNCEGLFTHHAFLNCSLGLFFGYDSVNNLPTCKPQDMLEERISGNLTSVGVSEYSCPHDCHMTKFEFSQSVASLDTDTMDKYIIQYSALINRTLDLGSTKDFASVTFFFETFDYPINNLYKEGFFDFLSKAGGTMGLVIGASIFSFMETIFFFAYFLKIVIRHFLY